MTSRMLFPIQPAGLPAFLFLLLSLFLAPALSGCGLIEQNQSEPALVQPIPAVQGYGLSAPGQADPATARQQAFAAALVDGLGKAVPVEDRSLKPVNGETGDGVVVLSGNGRVEGFAVLRQQVLVNGRPVDDVTVAVRQGRVLVVRNGLLVRLDPELAPLIPAHTEDRPRFAGLAVGEVRFSGHDKDAVTACRVVLGDPATAASPRPVQDRDTASEPEPALQETDIPFDALVVDARQCALAPSRLVRLLGPDGTEIYGPGRVEAGVLVERGPAGFTTTYDKALVILAAWGASNPLTVRCERADGPEGIVLSAQGEEALARADAEAGFLRQGRVVVLLPGDQAAP